MQVGSEHLFSLSIIYGISCSLKVEGSQSPDVVLNCNKLFSNRGPCLNIASYAELPLTLWNAVRFLLQEKTKPSLQTAC